ncbi:MAG: hypothetical protein AAFR94_07050 [Pseudomonadota bacterium]
MAIIRLNLTDLEASGALSPPEAQRLKTLALPEKAGSVWVNCLLIFGALAVAAGAIALIPTPTTGLLLAVAALGGAAVLRHADQDRAWGVLGSALAIMGATGLCGWIAAETWDTGTHWPPMAMTIILAVCAAAFRSSLLAALSVLAFGSVLGTGTAYWHASYGLFVQEPTVTILAFAALAAGLYSMRGRADDAWQGLLTAAARTAVFLANFGFWVGSLWGDRLGEHWMPADTWETRQAWRDTAVSIPEGVFTLGWAAALIAVIMNTARGSFLSITAIVFLAIHGYTQYFELLGAEPATLIVAGLSAIGLAAVGAERLRKAPSNSS